MTDTELIFALFCPVHIREDFSEDPGQFTEEQRRQHIELLNDLRSEQEEQM